MSPMVMGFVISPKGITSDLENTEAIPKWHVPARKNFHGLATFHLLFFVQNFSTIMTTTTKPEFFIIYIGQGSKQDHFRKSKLSWV